MKSLFARNRNYLMIMTAVTALITTIMTGCASDYPLVGSNQMSIEKASSDQVSIDTVYVRKTDQGLDVVGKAKFTRPTTGTPSEGISITVIAPDGKELYKSHTHYYRHGSPVKRSNTFNFSFSIPLTPPRGSTLRLAPIPST